MKSIFPILFVGLFVIPLFGAEPVLTEDWSGATDSSITGWVVVQGQGEYSVGPGQGGGTVLSLSPKALFNLRTEKVYEVGPDLAIRAQIAVPADSSQSGAGFGVRNELLGPEVGYRVLINRSQNMVRLFRLIGPKEVALADVTMPLPSGMFRAELRIRRAGLAKGAKLDMLIDGKSVLDHDDTEEVALGQRVRVMISCRGGKSMNIGKVELEKL